MGEAGDVSREVRKRLGLHKAASLHPALASASTCWDTKSKPKPTRMELNCGRDTDAGLAIRAAKRDRECGTVCSAQGRPSKPGVTLHIPAHVSRHLLNYFGV